MHHVVLCLLLPGVSKFLGGMLGAAFSPRLMLACGLMATSVINITFGFTTGVFWWTALWALNGGLQVRAAQGTSICHDASGTSGGALVYPYSQAVEQLELCICWCPVPLSSNFS